MNINFKSDLNQTYLIVEGEELVAEDYQLQMLYENEIPGVLKTEGRFINGGLQYYYDISGMTSLAQNYEHEKLGYEEIFKIVESLSQVLRNLKRYMLNGEKLLLEPEYIFRKNNEIFFCYYPQNQQEMKSSFHKLTEYFVRQVDYRDERGVHLAYLLHKATMEEYYSVDQIMKEFVSEEEEAQKEKESQIVTYESSVAPDESYSMVNEKKNSWLSIEKIRDVLKTKKWKLS